MPIGAPSGTDGRKASLKAFWGQKTRKMTGSVRRIRFPSQQRQTTVATTRETHARLRTILSNHWAYGVSVVPSRVLRQGRRSLSAFLLPREMSVGDEGVNWGADSR